MPKKAVVPVPKTLGEAAQFLARIGREQRAIDWIQSNLNTKVEELKAKAMADAKPHQERISELMEGLFAYGEAHRDELTDSGRRKTVEVPTGIFGWRMTPPAVSLRNVRSILEYLESLGLRRFIRIKKEVNKEALLKEPEVAGTIKGVRISQREEFVAKPAELEVEVVTPVGRRKKASS
ncbi:host-nuclease inhibitor Gam family protein [Patescibacteria group bacterium]|nr:host-nuclease inhibitor Gam family protein [Patescibacteria group bacterium]